MHHRAPELREPEDVEAAHRDQAERKPRAIPDETGKCAERHPELGQQRETRSDGYVSDELAETLRRDAQSLGKCSVVRGAPDLGRREHDGAYDDAEERQRLRMLGRWPEQTRNYVHVPRGECRMGFALGAAASGSARLRACQRSRNLRRTRISSRSRST